MLQDETIDQQQKETGTDQQKGIKADEPKEIKAEEPKEIETDEPKEIKVEEPKEKAIGEDSAVCCAERIKERAGGERRDLINRLSRIEGQVRGVKKMVEEDAYCVNILTQVAAANAALNSFTRVLLEEHIKTCVTSDIMAGREDTVDELIMLLKKLMK